jgi:hypothetical protein
MSIFAALSFSLHMIFHHILKPFLFWFVLIGALVTLVLRTSTTVAVGLALG